MVAHVGVDHIGKIDGRGAGGEVDHVALGGKDEDLVGKHVDLQVVEEVLRVGLLLAFQQAPDPGKAVLVAGAQHGAALTHLVFPVGGNAVFSRVMHLPGADLHLEGDARAADNGGVDALIHIGLGGGDIVLETPGNRLEHIVNDAEHVVTVRDRVNDHAEGAEIEDAADVQLLGVHLAVDAVHVLDAAVDRRVDALLVQTGLDLALHSGHEGLQLRHSAFQGRCDLPVARGIKVLEREVFQLPFDTLDSEPVGDGGIDLHRLQRLGALLLGGLVSHRAHIVQPVGNFDENDADVLGHGHEHLADVLHLLVLDAGVLHARELGDALNDVGHSRAEGARNVGVGQRGILDHIVQQRGDDRILI